MHTITLTSQQFQIILNALGATEQSGGSSAHYVLRTMLHKISGLPEDLDGIVRLQKIATYEYLRD